MTLMSEVPWLPPYILKKNILIGKSRQQKSVHNIRKYLKEYSETTSIHGIHYLSEKRSKIEKFVWAVIILLSISGCIFMICRIWNKYENNPMVISFATKETPIYELPFPAVTICPESKCARVKFNYTDVYYRLLKNRSITPEEAQNFAYLSLLCESDVDDEDPLEFGSKTVNNNFFEIIESLKPKHGALYCEFMGKTYNNCQDIFFPIITDVGFCYSFNILDRNDIFTEEVVHFKDLHNVGNDSKHFDHESGYLQEAGITTYPRRALMSGIDNALVIYFEHRRSDTDFICNTFLEGFRVLLHNPMDIPRLSKHYFRVPLDKFMVASVEPQLIKTSSFVTSFKRKIRRCYLKTERALKYFKIYTQSNCFLECLTDYTLTKCGCVRFFMPRQNTTPICGSKSEECWEEAENEVKIKDLESKISGSSKTFCECEPLCTHFRYDVVTSQSDFYWQEYIAKIADQKIVSYDDHDVENYSVLFVYFKRDQFMALERKELYGATDFISHFGGLLGLFTGFSLMSLAETVYFLTLRILCNIKLYGKWSGPNK